MKVRNYLIESQTDSHIVCKTIEDVETVLNGKCYNLSEPNLMGDVYVSVPLWREAREKYIAAKMKHVNQHGSNQWNCLLFCCLFGWVSITGVDSGYWNCYNLGSVGRCYWFGYYGGFA